MQDYAFGSGNGDSSAQTIKIDWKAVFFNPSQGDNKIRIVSMAGKKTKVHWVTYHNSEKKVCVRCPSEGCPICIAGEKAKTNYILKIIDRATQTLRLYEFSKQIKDEIERLSVNLKKEKSTANDSLSQYDLNVEKGAKNANPLYHVNIIGKNKLETNKEKLLAESDAELIENDILNIEELIKPWSVKRIREQVYGIDENGNPVENKYVPKVPTAGVPNDGSVPDTDPSFNYGANVEKNKKNTDGVDPKDTEFLNEL
jgi:hypothetical protein